MEETSVSKTLSNTDREMMRLVHIGFEQGWTVDAKGGSQLVWKGPNGEGPVTTPNRIQGRGLANVIALLQRNGLDLSAVKPDKPKEERPGVHINAPTIGNMADDFDKHSMDETAAAARAAMAARTGNYDPLMAQYIDSVTMAMVTFIKDGDLRPAEDSEAVKLYTEASDECTRLTGLLDKAKADLSRVGTELQSERQARVAAEERAVTAENKLRTLQQILGGA
jgi:hypothetical protein